MVTGFNWNLNNLGTAPEQDEGGLDFKSILDALSSPVVSGALGAVGNYLNAAGRKSLNPADINNPYGEAIKGYLTNVNKAQLVANDTNKNAYDKEYKQAQIANAQSQIAKRDQEIALREGVATGKWDILDPNVFRKIAAYNPQLAVALREERMSRPYSIGGGGGGGASPTSTLSTPESTGQTSTSPVPLGGDLLGVIGKLETGTISDPDSIGYHGGDKSDGIGRYGVKPSTAAQFINPTTGKPFTEADLFTPEGNKLAAQRYIDTIKSSHPEWNPIDIAMAYRNGVAGWEKKRSNPDNWDTVDRQRWAKLTESTGTTPSSTNLNASNASVPTTAIPLQQEERIMPLTEFQQKTGGSIEQWQKYSDEAQKRNAEIRTNNVKAVQEQAKDTRDEQQKIAAENRAVENKTVQEAIKAGTELRSAVQNAGTKAIENRNMYKTQKDIIDRGLQTGIKAGAHRARLEEQARLTGLTQGIPFIEGLFNPTEENMKDVSLAKQLDYSGDKQAVALLATGILGKNPTDADYNNALKLAVTSKDEPAVVQQKQAFANAAFDWAENRAKAQQKFIESGGSLDKIVEFDNKWQLDNPPPEIPTFFYNSEEEKLNAEAEKALIKQNEEAVKRFNESLKPRFVTQPVEGAKKGKDGKWYVERDGKYFEVQPDEEK